MKRMILAFCCIAITFITYFLLNSTSFERTPPSINLSVLKDRNTAFPFNTDFLNPGNEVRLNAFDSSGLAEYSILVTNEQGKIILQKNEILLKNSKDLEVILPKLPNLANGEKITYSVSVRDWSNTNFFTGNTTTLTKHLTINNIPPTIQIIALSKSIVYGGSALIAFQIHNLSTKNNTIGHERVVLSNGKNDFQAYPFINKHGRVIYLCLMAWPITNTFFEGKIRVLDDALNEQILPIPITININHIKRKFNVNLDNKYLDKIWNQLKTSDIEMPADLVDSVDKFQFLNETIRQQDNQRITHFFQDGQSYKHTTLPRFNVFNPLENATISGRFGDEYIYRYNNENIGYSQRIGLDIINTKSSRLINSNFGFLVFKDKLGMYNNLIAINHDLGLTSIYGYLHDLPNLPTTLQPYDTLDNIQQNTTTTNTIYFGILVQGYFVNPQEWMDKGWIDSNINHVLEIADDFNE